MVTALGGIAPIGAFPVGASFLIVVGTTKRLVLIGSKTLRVFASAFLRRKSSPSFTNCDLKRGEGQNLVFGLSVSRPGTGKALF